MDELQILVKAIVDDSSEQSMDSQLGSLAKKLSEAHKINLKVALEESSVKSVQNQLQAIAKQVKTTSSSAGGSGAQIKVFDSTQLKADGQRYFNGVRDIVSRAQKEFGKMGKVDVTNVFKDAKGNIQSFTASVTKADGVVEKFNFELAKIKNGTRNLTGFVQSNSILSDKSAGTGLEKTLNYLNKIDTEIADITSRTLVNTSKPLLGDMEQYNQYQTKLSEVKTRIEEIKTANTMLSADHKREIDSMVADLDRYAKELQSVAYVAFDLKAATLPATQEELQAKLQTNIQKWTNAGIFGGDFQMKVLEAKRLLDEATNPSDLDEYRHRLKMLSEEFRQLGLTAKQQEQSLTNQTLATNIQTAQTRIENLRQTYSKFLQDPNLSQKWQALFESSQIVTTQKELANLNARIRLFEQELIKADKHAKSFFGNLKANAAKMAEWMVLGGVIAAIMRGITGIYDSVVDLNTAMTELKKVTDETDAAYDAFLSSAADKAVKIGTAYADFVTSTADFARLGYTMEDAESLAEVATIYSVVGDEITDVDEATSSIISTMKAFGIQVEDAMTIADKFNAVGNNFAISSGGIGEAMQRSAAALAEANNTIDESIALMVAANNVIQDPTMVGTMWKTVSMRIRGATTELEEAGLETEYMAESTATLRKEIKALTNIDGSGGFDIMLDADNFKSTYDIILGISEVWSEISDIDQAALLELLAGKRQGNALAAAITNMGDAVKVLETSVESEGSALEEHEKWMESITAKQQQFQAQYEAMSNAILKSGLVTGLYGLGTGLLSIITSLAKLNVLLPTIVTSVTMIKSFKAWQTATQTAAAISSLVTRLVSEKTATDALVASYQTLTFKQQQDVANKLKQAVASGQLTTEEYNEIAAKLGLTAATMGTAAATDTLNFSIKELLASNPIGWIITAISLLPTLIGWIKSAHKSNEELIQDADELKNAYQTESVEISTDLTTLNGLKDEFSKLSKGVGDYGENISLAADDYERYQEIVNTILGVSPSLVSGYDAEGNAIANKNGLLEKSIKLMEEEQRLRMKEFVSDKNLTTIGLGEVAAIEEYENDNPLPYGDAKLEFMNAFRDAANRYAAETQGNYEGEIYDALNPGNIDLDDFWTEGYWNKYSDDANRFAQDYYEIIVDSLRSNRSILEEYFTQDEIDELLDIADKYDENMKVYENKIDEFSKTLNPTLQYVPQTITAYSELTDGQKEFLTHYINNFRITADTTEDDILQMKQDILDFTEFVAGNEDLKSVITVGISLQNGKDKDGNILSVADYEAAVKDFIASLGNLDEDTQVRVKAVFGIDTDSFSDSDIQLALDHVRNLLKDEYDDSIGEFSVQDAVDIYYNITADPNSLTLEELQKMLAELRNIPADTFDVSAFAEGLSKVKESYSLLSTALEEIADGKGISAETIQSLADEEEDYLDYLYEENGVVKLNVEAWESRSRAIVESDLSAIRNEIDALEEENGVIREKIDYYEEQRSLGNDGGLWNNLIVEETKNLEENNRQLEEKNKLLKMVKAAYESVETTSWEHALSVFDTANDKLQVLANFQETLSDGYKLSADEAREFAEVYPEILDSATVSANGEIKLNESVVNAFIERKNAEIKAAAQAEADKLKASQAVLQAELDIVNTQIEAAKTGNDAVVKSANESAAAKMAIEQAVLTACEQAGIDETTANQLALAAMTGDWDTFSTLAEQAVYDLDTESATAFTSVMNNFATMSQNMVNNANEVIGAFSRMGLALENAMQGATTAQYSSKVVGGSVSGSGGTAVSGLMTEMFDAAKSGYGKDGVTSYSDSLQAWQEQLQSIADTYTNTSNDLESLYAQQSSLSSQISAIDNQIALLQSLGNTPLKNFSSTNKSGEGKTAAEELEDKIKELQEQLDALLGDYEHKIFLLERNDGTPEEIVAIYKKMQEALHGQAEMYRSMGLDENSDYIQDLQKQWWDYQDTIEDMLHDIYKTTVEEHENTISYLESQYDALDSNRSGDAMTENLNKQLEAQRAIQRAAVEEADRLRAMGLEENDEAIQECIDTWWDAESAIRDINGQIAENVLGVFDDFIEYADGFELWGDLDFTKVDYLKQKIEAINKLFKDGVLTLKEYNSLLRETQLEIYNEQKEALTEIIEMTMELVRQEAEDKVEALEQQIEDYQKIIELKKKSLATSEEEEDYEKEVAKRVAEIAEIQAKIAQLDRDDSREANAEKQQLAQELAQLQEELADYQADYAYNAQVDALDKEAETFEDTKNKEIAKVEATVDTEEEVYNAAIARIDSNWEQLYQDLIEWNRQYGDMIDGEDSITSAWQTAKAAAEEYGSVVSALNGISSSIAYEEEQIRNQQYTEEAIHQIIKEMYANSQAHHSADTAGKARLNKRNLELGAMLAQYGITAVRGNDGVWYVDRVGGEQLYDKYRQYTYHTGGIVGEDPALKPNEVLAKLEIGEAVLTKEEFSGLFDKMKAGIIGVVDALVGGLTASEPVVSEVMKSVTNNNVDTDNSVSEQGIEIHNEFHMQNVTEENMKQFADYYSDYTIAHLLSAAKRKGVKNTIGSHMLR